MSMNNEFEQFEEELHNALMHLNDPDYRPSALLLAVLGYDPGQVSGPVRSDIIQAIKDLEPLSELPLDTRARRDFDVLHHRFLLGLTQLQTAHRMNTSVRTVRRTERKARYVLACRLWKQRPGWEVLAENLQEEDMIISDDQSATWLSQAKQDLASLQAGAPEGVANVGESIRHAVQVAQGLLPKDDSSMHVGHIDPSMTVAVHPSVLRQTLVVAIARLARCVSPGQITILAAYRDDEARIVLTSPASPEGVLPDVASIREVLALQGGSVEVAEEEGRISLCIETPVAGGVKVLVVDDNMDLVHFYKRSVRDTKYYIVHAVQGQRTFDAIQAIAPDIIILDILLPDADGWELLMKLRGSAATQSIPIIVCSIVTGEELIRSYSAVQYLRKPFSHRQLIQALDQALDQASTGSLRSPGSNAAVV